MDSLLASVVVEAILDGIEPDGLSIAKLTEPPIPAERAAEALRLPGAVTPHPDWRQEKSCRLFSFPGALWRGFAAGRETGRDEGRGAEKGAKRGCFRAGPM